MKHYEELLKTGCFSREKLIKILGSPAAANSLIYEYQVKGLIEKVRRDFYVVISLETKQPVLSRYQIGSNLFDDAYITHHSAFEVFGYGNQVYYECYVATEKRFSDFEYDGVRYRRVERKPQIEVVKQNNICFTSIEQTVVDSIRDFEKIAGLEETIRCIMLIPSLNEKMILECLARNDNGYLYQKCGYVFGNLRDDFHFSNKFLDECERHISGANKYLQRDLHNNVFHERWKLYAPLSLNSLIDKGVGDYDVTGQIDNWEQSKRIGIYKRYIGKGLSLGNQASQWFAIYYLDEFDQLIKEKLIIKYYSRYMDDCVLIYQDKDYLCYCLEKMRQCAKELKIDFNNKTEVFPLKNGVDYLEWHIYLTESGKVIRKVKQQTKHKYKRKLKYFQYAYADGNIELNKINQVLSSYRAHLAFGHTYKLQKIV